VLLDSQGVLVNIVFIGQSRCPSNIVFIGQSRCPSKHCIYWTVKVS